MLIIFNIDLIGEPLGKFFICFAFYFSKVYTFSLSSIMNKTINYYIYFFNSSREQNTMVTNSFQMMTQNSVLDRDWKKKNRGVFSLG